MPEFNETFEELVDRLKSKDYKAIAERMTANPEILDMQHAITGLLTEVGELADMLKRHIYYGAPLDFTNGKEEVGDVLFYAQLFAKAAGFDLENSQKAVQRKLTKRYPNSFNNEDAVNRNTEEERNALEGK